MNYLQVKTQFQAVLNRRDITSTLTENFVQQAIQRAQRLLRVPAMEKSVIVSYLKDDESLDIPGDLLQFINVFWTNNGDGVTIPLQIIKLERTDIGNVRVLRNSVNTPSAYARQIDQIVVGAKPISDGSLRIDYYANFPSLSADADHNWLTDIAPDIIIYGALSFAADYFLDNRKDAFEQRFQEGLAELTNQAIMDELAAGAAIQPAYSMNF